MTQVWCAAASSWSRPSDQESVVSNAHIRSGSSRSSRSKRLRSSPCALLSNASRSRATAFGSTRPGATRLAVGSHCTHSISRLNTHDHQVAQLDLPSVVYDKLVVEWLRQCAGHLERAQRHFNAVGPASTNRFVSREIRGSSHLNILCSHSREVVLVLSWLDASDTVNAVAFELRPQHVKVQVRSRTRIVLRPKCHFSQEEDALWAKRSALATGVLPVSLPTDTSEHALDGCFSWCKTAQTWPACRQSRSASDGIVTTINDHRFNNRPTLVVRTPLPNAEPFEGIDAGDTRRPWETIPIALETRVPCQSSFDRCSPSVPLAYCCPVRSTNHTRTWWLLIASNFSL